MLLGRYTHNVDVKGRVFVPSKWRVDMGDTVIIYRGIMGEGDARCLFAVSVDAWRKLSDRLNEAPLSDMETQSFKRKLTSNACDCDTDKQGRILIPPTLRDYAGIGEEVILVGASDRIELWSPAAWESWNGSDETYSADMITGLKRHNI